MHTVPHKESKITSAEREGVILTVLADRGKEVRLGEVGWGRGGEPIQRQQK